MKITEPTPPTPEPEIYILASPVAASHSLRDMLRRFRGYRVRCFGPDDIPSLLSEFRKAHPRPGLLITTIMGDGTGLRVAQTCREIEPSLKVLRAYAYAYPEEKLREFFAKHPVTIDATIRVPCQSRELNEMVYSLIGAPANNP